MVYKILLCQTKGKFEKRAFCIPAVYGGEGNPNSDRGENKLGYYGFPPVALMQGVVLRAGIVPPPNYNRSNPRGNALHPPRWGIGWAGGEGRGVELTTVATII
jgi:hypothetical protein